MYEHYDLNEYIIQEIQRVGIMFVQLICIQTHATTNLKTICSIRINKINSKYSTSHFKLDSILLVVCQ